MEIKQHTFEWLIGHRKFMKEVKKGLELNENKNIN